MPCPRLTESRNSLAALYDVIRVDGADTRHNLLVLDGIARRLVKLAKTDYGAGFGGLVDLGGDRDERKPELAFAGMHELPSPFS